MKTFAVQVAQRTCIGSRTQNEDCIAVEHLQGHWCLVLSDGAPTCSISGVDVLPVKVGSPL